MTNVEAASKTSRTPDKDQYRVPAVSLGSVANSSPADVSLGAVPNSWPPGVSLVTVCRLYQHYSSTG
jgi:hypothetical protein